MLQCGVGLQEAFLEVLQHDADGKLDDVSAVGRLGRFECAVLEILVRRRSSSTEGEEAALATAAFDSGTGVLEHFEKRRIRKRRLESAVQKRTKGEDAVFFRGKAEHLWREGGEIPLPIDVENSEGPDLLILENEVLLGGSPLPENALQREVKLPDSHGTLKRLLPFKNPLEEGLDAVSARPFERAFFMNSFLLLHVEAEACDAIFDEEVEDFVWVLERVACDNSDDMKINASAFEERDATHGPFVCSGAAARFAVSIVNAGGAIDAHAHANSSLLNKIAPFLVEQSGVGLEGVGDSNPNH